MTEVVQIEIGGKAWRFWSDFEINTGLDSYSTVAFTAPHEPQRREFREAFRPFAYTPVTVGLAGGEKLFNGTMLPPAPTFDEESSRVAVQCYSKPGVLLDSDAPASLLPFESRGLTIKQIADRLCQPFGIAVVMADDAQPGAPFKRVKQKLDGKVQDYLVSLAQQRGLILSDNGRGNLVILRSRPVGQPVAALEEGAAPVTSVSSTFNASDYYSEITGVTSQKMYATGARVTERNPRPMTGIRCQTVVLDDTEKADAPAAVRARMGRMFGNAFSVSVEVPTWRDPAGRLWRPNTTIKLKAPSAMVYAPYNFIVRTVSMRNNNNAETATLGLVMPGAFSGETPARFPWD